MSAASSYPLQRRCQDEKQQMRVCWHGGAKVEITHITRREKEKERFCLKLFRRAMITHDEEIWAYIYHERVMRDWFSEHHQTSRIMKQENDASVVQSTLAELTTALTPAWMEHLSRFRAVHHCLKHCAHRALYEEVDERKAHQREDTLDTREQEAPYLADSILSQICMQELWRMVWDCLPEDQLILLVLTCDSGLKPVRSSWIITSAPLRSKKSPVSSTPLCNVLDVLSDISMHYVIREEQRCSSFLLPRPKGRSVQGSGSPDEFAGVEIRSIYPIDMQKRREA